jgi:predicted tellurium resistance membrane protein TerC
VILAFVAVKMLLSEWFHVAVGLSLAVIAVILTVSVVVSMRHGEEAEAAPEEAPDPL